MLKLVMALTLAVWCANALAQMHKCTGPDGKTTYTDRPCQSAERKQSVVITDNKLDGSELRTESARARAQFSSPRRADTAQVEGSNELPDPSSRACTLARRDYEVEASIKTQPDLRKMEQKRQAAEESCGVRQQRNPDHIVEQSRQALEEQRRLRAEEVARSAPAIPQRTQEKLTRCAGAYCYDSNGDSYSRQANDGYVIRRDGTRCRVFQGSAICN